MPSGKTGSKLSLTISASGKFRMQGNSGPAEGSKSEESFHVAIFEALAPAIIPKIENYLARLRGRLTRIDQVGPVSHIRIDLPRASRPAGPSSFLARGCRVALALDRILQNH